MINSLFVNASILITFLCLSSPLFKDTKVSIKSNMKVKLTIGLVFGICGCVLMFNGVNLAENMFMDFRIIALIISAIYCGPISAFVTAICIITFRIGNFGICSTSIVATVNLIILTIIFSFFAVSKYPFKIKYLIMCIMNVLASILWTFVLEKDSSVIIKILLHYILSNIIVSIIIYYVMVYLFKTEELYSKLKFESTKDYLTGLNNVREFDLRLNQAISDTLENDKNLSLLMLDIDNFKKVNDTYGHITGDLILKQLSEILIKSCRSFDFISRKGGEEFCVILSDSNFEQAFEIAERIRKNVQENYFITDNNEKINITISIGVSSYPGKANNISNLMEIADKALYYAKNNGKNQVQ
jgi:diguanylate cyclase